MSLQALAPGLLHPPAQARRAAAGCGGGDADLSGVTLVRLLSMSRYYDPTPIQYQGRRWDWYAIGKQDAEDWLEWDITTFQEMLAFRHETSAWFFPVNRRELEDYERGWNEGVLRSG